jgi:hypothetical protein
LLSRVSSVVDIVSGATITPHFILVGTNSHLRHDEQVLKRLAAKGDQPITETEAARLSHRLAMYGSHRGSQ